MYNSSQPVVNDNFEIRLESKNSPEIKATFTEYAGLQCSLDIIKHREVTPQSWGIDQNRGFNICAKLPGNSEYSNLILRSCSSYSDEFWNWFHKTKNNQWFEQIQDITIFFSDENNNDRFTLTLVNAWPVRYKINDGSTSDAQIQIEEVEFAFSHFDRDLSD